MTMGPGSEAAIVVGGGLAGCAAAVVLAERGCAVTLIEREPVLGGRLAGWPIVLSGGETVVMERGFHAFFRQYYNLRALMRRVDPTLASLRPVSDYPLVGPGGWRESFADLPRRPPMNVVALVRRSPSLRLRDLLRVNAGAALEMLRFSMGRTYARFDGVSARDYLDSLGFPARGRQMLFEVFAHSFFNPEEDMSAAELLMMFHFYFMANREGLVFDVLDRPFSEALWRPLAGYLERRGVRIELSTAIERMEHSDGTTTCVSADGRRWAAEGVVLALAVPALRSVIGRSEGLGGRRWRRAIEGLSVTRPFAVWRRWMDTPMRPDRPPFVGTAGLGLLDNISLYHDIQDESRAWSERSGGSVVELHAYAVPHGVGEEEMRSEMWASTIDVYPELAGARAVDEVFLLRQDCPGFPPGSHADRPGVETPVPGLALAGDFVKLPFPSALMERAVTSGFMAANWLLAGRGIEAEPVRRGVIRGWLPL